MHKILICTLKYSFFAEKPHNLETILNPKEAFFSFSLHALAQND